MYIKNRQNRSEIKAFDSYQTMCLTENFTFLNPQLLISKPLPVMLIKTKVSI